jgi:hypothetical protein
MFLVEEMLKDKRLLFTADTIKSTRDGELSTSIEQVKLQPRDLIETSVSTSTEHST